MIISCIKGGESLNLITVIVDCTFDGFLERLEQVVGGKQTGTEVCLNLEGISSPVLI